jgi:FMN phosphatase YigB (HAD superfamily)
LGWRVTRPPGPGRSLRGLQLPADLIATSADWGASKPDAAFFEAVVTAAPCPAGQIAYVGDRLDNDLKPAKAAGMHTVFIRRGPWGYAWEHHPDLAGAADWQVTSLAETARSAGAYQRLTHVRPA